jgi:hypothetical protein
VANTILIAALYSMYVFDANYVLFKYAASMSPCLKL